MLRFACLDAAPEPYAAGPTLVFGIGIDDEPGRQVHSIALRTQIRIEPRGRAYTSAEAARLVDLFGERDRWGETLNPLQLATVGTTVAGFTGSTSTAVPVPLTYDLDISATKYFHALEPGEAVPLRLLFSGTVFYAGPSGVQVGLVSWHEDATFRLPVATWRAAMDEHFPDSTWVRISRSTLDALAAYRSERTIPNWDDTIERLLKEAGA
ncbi:DUF6084 family protein [Pseudonocardia sp. TRM90224]|uniref:DUF6084 family protein n=1 Tax=Pseudonocardia sp. TRM90224 TaxID=2812678 RepID=UPI001E4E3126|nr:DUF6084 family protein [Pseudonocardia sp. TRM90224]